MAWTYNIENAQGTVNLNSGACKVIDYAAKSAPVFDGTETVDEPFRILITGTSRADVDAVVGTIQRAFRTAERWQDNQSGPRTFFTRSLADDSTTKRSELVRAAFEVSAPEYLGTNIYGGGYGTYRTELSGVVTRRNWWEGAEVQLPLTNPNGTANITGLTVYNENCGTGTGTLLHYNWFDIAGTSILGDLPAAYRAEYTSINNSMNFEMYMPVTLSSAKLGTAFDSIHWAESFDSGAIVGTAYAVTGASNGSITEYSVKAGDSFSKVVSTFGNYIATYPGDTDYRFFLSMSNGTIPTVTTFLTSTQLTDYNISSQKYVSILTDPLYTVVGNGMIPYTYRPSYPAGTSFTLKMNIAPTSGTQLLRVDYFSCVRGDQYREINLYKTSAVGDVVTDDELDSMGVFAEISSYLTPYSCTAVGKIRLIPGVYHRLYVFGKFGTFATSERMAVKFYYRPRYLAL